MFPNHHVAAANCLWISAHVGIGCYIHNSRHISKLKFPQNVMFTSFLSIMFNFGSALLVATLKTALPENRLQTVCGILAQLFFIISGKQYLDSV